MIMELRWSVVGLNRIFTRLKRSHTHTLKHSHEERKRDKMLIELAIYLHLAACCWNFQQSRALTIITANAAAVMHELKLSNA